MQINNRRKTEIPKHKEICYQLEPLQETDELCCSRKQFICRNFGKLVNIMTGRISFKSHPCLTVCHKMSYFSDLNSFPDKRFQTFTISLTHHVIQHFAPDVLFLESIESQNAWNYISGLNFVTDFITEIIDRQPNGIISRDVPGPFLTFLTSIDT